MLSLRQLHPYDAAIAEAERCRKEARAAVEQDVGKYAQLRDQPSGWCVVTQKGLWSRSYHNVYGQEQLREYIDRGHKVLLTVGIVAKPDAPLNADTHVARVKVADPGRLSDDKLHLVSTRAKLHATRALLN